jgi:type 1 fimbria pilin
MKRTYGIFAFLMFVIITMMRWANADENIKFSGTLVALPCSIPESDQSIPVNFDTVNAHALYLEQAMPRVPFILHLVDCDTSIAGKVSVTFTGTEDPELPGFLGLESSQSGASGVAIGLESKDGNKITLNKSTPDYALNQEDNELTFKAYIIGEPVALKHQNIKTGKFNATATMELNYE